MPKQKRKRRAAEASGAGGARALAVEMVALSVVVAIPALLMPLAAGDHPSHLYNAWLAQLVERGQAPGLRLAHMSSNVLYDLLLSGVGRALGLQAGQRVVTVLFVLGFFWGVYWMVAAAAHSSQEKTRVGPGNGPTAESRNRGNREKTRTSEKRSCPPAIVALLMMLSYGWTFNVGLMNFYGSVGLACAGIALWWRGPGRHRWLIVPLGALAYVAHPMGAAWLAAAIVYSEVEKRLPRYGWIALMGACVGVLAAARAYLAHRYTLVEWPEPWWLRTGADQFYLFRHVYRYVGYAAMLVLAGWIAQEGLARLRGRSGWREAATPAQLYGLGFAAMLILPNGVYLPIYPAPVNYICTRATVLLVAMAMCVAASSHRRAWHLPVTAALAAVFFVLLAGDGGRLASLERQAAEKVATLPAKTRVVDFLWWPESRVLIQHLPDAACVERCYAYANYEPSSQQFRVRAEQANPVVIESAAAVIAMQLGRYVVRPQDTPLFEIYQCGSGLRLCLHELRATEPNGWIVVKDGWVQKATRNE